jgi:hypothetical protein
MGEIPIHAEPIHDNDAEYEENINFASKFYGA